MDRRYFVWCLVKRTFWIRKREFFAQKKLLESLSECLGSTFLSCKLCCISCPYLVTTIYGMFESLYWMIVTYGYLTLTTASLQNILSLTRLFGTKNFFFLKKIKINLYIIDFHFIERNSTYSFSINFSTLSFILACAKLYACKIQF